MPQPVAARLTRWALSAAAGLLAACHGSVATPLVDHPAPGTTGETPSKMGKVSSTELGDVATPLPPQPPQPPPPKRVIMGEAAVPTDPTHPPTPENPPVHEDK